MAIRTSAAVHASPALMWWVMLNRTRSGPPPLFAQIEKPNRKPMPSTQAPAATQPALTRACRPPSARTRVVRPLTRPSAMPSAVNPAMSGRSLPAVGIECR